jgi:hypothetical protein
MKNMLYYDAPTWLVVVSCAVLIGLILHQLKIRKGRLMKQKDNGNRDETAP